jgi:hypothetical protein
LYLVHAALVCASSEPPAPNSFGFSSSTLTQKHRIPTGLHKVSHAHLYLTKKGCVVGVFFFNFFFLASGGMRRVKTFDDSSRPQLPEKKASKPLRRSIGDIPVSKSSLSVSGLLLLAFGAVWALIFFFDRSNVVAKALAV